MAQEELQKLDISDLLANVNPDDQEGMSVVSAAFGSFVNTGFADRDPRIPFYDTDNLAPGTYKNNLEVSGKGTPTLLKAIIDRVQDRSRPVPMKVVTEDRPDMEGKWTGKQSRFGDYMTVHFPPNKHGLSKGLIIEWRNENAKDEQVWTHMEGAHLDQQENLAALKNMYEIMRNRKNTDANSLPSELKISLFQLKLEDPSVDNSYQW